MDMKDNVLSPHLKKIMATSVAMDEAEKRLSIKTVKDVLENHMIPTMQKVDPLFSQIGHNNVYWTGSMYDRLRVKEATEFDVNVILVIPYEMELVNVNNNPGFASIQLPEDCSDTALLKLCEGSAGNKLLMPEKVRSWMQSVVHRSLSELADVPVKEKKYRTSGPAITISVTAGSKVIDVDLVPVVTFSEKHWPSSVRPKVAQHKKDFFAVPKTESFLTDKSLWRLGFSQSERSSVLYNKGCIKMIIRLIKCMRENVPNIEGLSSYHIKVAVMWMLEKHGEYEERHLGSIFMLALKTLRDYALKGELPNYWCPQHNIWTGKHVQMTNIGGRLATIIREIERDPQNVNDYFRSPSSAVGASVQPTQMRMDPGMDEPEEEQQQETDSSSGGRCIIA